jgi:hypothetical protein
MAAIWNARRATTLWPDCFLEKSICYVGPILQNYISSEKKFPQNLDILPP